MDLPTLAVSFDLYQRKIQTVDRSPGIDAQDTPV
jgi:hypothetical protein